MTDINTTLPLLEPLGSTIKNITNILSVLLGGVFGVYLLVLFLRWQEFLMIRQLKKDLNSKMKRIEKKIDSLKGSAGPDMKESKRKKNKK